MCLDNKQELHKICQKFKLTSNISLTNMYLFDKNEKLKHYVSAYEIIDDFVITRLEYYEIRKEHQLQKMQEELKIYSNKYKFVLELLNDTLDLRRKKSTEIDTLLTEHSYDTHDNSFGYLVKMPMETVNEENVTRLKNYFDNTTNAMNELSEKSILTMYLEELEELEKVL